MAHKLVTQVQAPDEAPKGPQGLVTQVKPESKVSPKPAHHPSCWWRLFCCCCKHTEPEEEKPVSTGGGTSAAAPVVASTPISSTTTASKDAESTPKKEPPSSESKTPPPEEEEHEERQSLLPEILPEHKGRKTLVLDLDETLVHSSFTAIPDADIVFSIELDGMTYNVYVRKRPGVDEFLRACGKKFEVVVFTASLAKYADPLLDILDKDRVVVSRLFREACVQYSGNYVKDLSLLGRKLEHSIIVDNSPYSYMFQPDNAVPITSWFNDKADTELTRLLPFLDTLIDVDDVSTILSRKTTF